MENKKIHKIIINSPRRSGSEFISALVRNCLPARSGLYTQKIDEGYSNAAKIDLWKTLNEREVQIALVREPHEHLVSLMQAEVALDTHNGRNVLANNDPAFIKLSNVTIKSLEKYYLAINDNTYINHMAFDFNCIKEKDGPRAIINKILQFTGNPKISDEFWELACETSLVQTSLTSAEIRNLPDGNDEAYQAIKDRINILKNNISFEALDKAYSLALKKCIQI